MTSASAEAATNAVRPRPDIGPYIAPRTPIETEVAAFLREILELDRVGMKDGFLALGGDSLTATLLLLRVRDSFGIELEPSLIFDSPDLAALSASIAESANRATADAAPVPSVQDRPDRIPLASEQQSLFRLYRMTQDKGGYNTIRAVRARTRIDVELLRQALTALLDRHEILRTRVRVVDDVPAQFIDPPATADLEVVDLRDLPAARRESEAIRRTNTFFRRPFDVEAERLFRACLISLADDDHILAVSMQHLVIDGGSLGLVVTDLVALYAALAGGAAMPPRAKLQYADYALWQKSAYPRLQESQAAFWSAYLDGFQPVQWLRPPLQPRGYRLGAHGFSLSPELSTALKKLGRDEDVTLGMVLFAANQIVLARLCGAEDMVGGMMFSRRTRREFQDVAGPMFMIFPVRTLVRPSAGFSELLQQVKSSLLKVYGHLEIEGTAIPRSWPMTNFNLLGDEDEDARRLRAEFQTLDKSARVEPFHLPETVDSTTPLDFSIELSERAGCVAGRIVYSLDLFDARSGAEIAGDFEALLARAVDDPRRPLSELLPMG